jgi:hypothetical protein
MGAGRHGPCTPMAKGRAALSRVPDPRPRPTAVKHAVRRHQRRNPVVRIAPVLHATGGIQVQGAEFLSGLFTAHCCALSRRQSGPGLVSPASSCGVSRLLQQRQQRPTIAGNAVEQPVAPDGASRRRRGTFGAGRLVLALRRAPAPQVNAVFSGHVSREVEYTWPRDSRNRRRPQASGGA